MEIKPNKTDGFGVWCHGQLVLEIEELSDRDTINLFLTCGDQSQIVESANKNDWPWTHEVLAKRNDQSRKKFISNEPVYKLVKEKNQMIKKIKPYNIGARDFRLAVNIDLLIDKVNQLIDVINKLEEGKNNDLKTTKTTRTNH